MEITHNVQAFMYGVDFVDRGEVVHWTIYLEKVSCDSVLIDVCHHKEFITILSETGVKPLMWEAEWTKCFRATFNAFPGTILHFP